MRELTCWRRRAGVDRGSVVTDGSWRSGEEAAWRSSWVLGMLSLGAASVSLGVIIAGGWRAWLPPSAAIAIGIALTSGAVALGVKGAEHQRSALNRAEKRAINAERRRLATDLHDGIAQDLALIATYFGQIERAMGKSHPVVTAARRALAVTRETISDLAEPPVTETPVQALTSLMHELTERFAIAVDFEVGEVSEQLTPQIAGQLRRIIQEAVTNAVRHGGATKITVNLSRHEGGVALRVADNGRWTAGTDAGAGPDAFGVRSMRERAAALGGLLVIEPLHSGGTALEVMLP